MVKNILRTQIPMLATYANTARFFCCAKFFPSWKLCLNFQETPSVPCWESPSRTEQVFMVNCSALWNSRDADEAAMLECSPELSGFQLRFLLLGSSCPRAAMFAELQPRGSRARQEQWAGSSTLCSAFPAAAGPTPLCSRRGPHHP